ncbi:MAG: sugar ABC transporter permease [Clostridiaceae bacterium]
MAKEKGKHPIKPSRLKKQMSMGGWFIIAGLLPILAVYTYLRFVPIAKTVYMSFFNWDYVTNNNVFINITNYVNMFKNQQFVTSLVNTTIIAFAMFVIIMPLSMLIANALNSAIKFRAWYEALYFLPVIMPMVPITIIWKWILNTDYGLLNWFLSIFGVAKTAWLTSATPAIIVVIAIMVWKNIGYNVLIFLVGLRGIPRSYYEAAAIDGANSSQSFRHISIPLLKPITVYVSVTTLIKGYNVYSLVKILASDVQGAPSYLVRVLVYDMIENGFRFYKMGYASAEAVILFIIVIVLTLAQMLVLRESDGVKRTQRLMKTRRTQK